MSISTSMIKRGLVITLFAAFQPASAQAPPVLAPGFHRLQQVAITTGDLERSIVFYRDTIGLKQMFVTNNMAFFDLAGTRLMVALDRKRQRSERTQSILYLDVHDFHAAVTRLKALGLPLDGPVETVQTTGAGALRLQQFTDPDGNALAVMGFVPQ